MSDVHDLLLLFEQLPNPSKSSFLEKLFLKHQNSRWISFKNTLSKSFLKFSDGKKTELLHELIKPIINKWKVTKTEPAEILTTNFQTYFTKKLGDPFTDSVFKIFNTANKLTPSFHSNHTLIRQAVMCLRKSHRNKSIFPEAISQSILNQIMTKSTQSHSILNCTSTTQKHLDYFRKQAHPQPDPKDFII